MAGLQNKPICGMHALLTTCSLQSFTSPMFFRLRIELHVFWRLYAGAHAECKMTYIFQNAGQKKACSSMRILKKHRVCERLQAKGRKRCMHSANWPIPQITFIPIQKYNFWFLKYNFWRSAIWLPTEIWADILRLLSRSYLVLCVHPVCSRLHKIAEQHVPSRHIIRNIELFVQVNNSLKKVEKYIRKIKN